jgi:hypothetical protein
LQSIGYDFFQFLFELRAGFRREVEATEMSAQILEISLFPLEDASGRIQASTVGMSMKAESQLLTYY